MKKTRLMVLLLLIPLLASATLTTLTGLRWVENPANDADSFHARRNRTRYVLRLYFVDAPETDNRFPERVREQAAYFGVTPEQVVQGGRDAAKLVETLVRGKDLRVHTSYQDARGAGDSTRIYAHVEVDGRALAEHLVENGYARIHGVGTDLPGGVSEKRFWSRLRTLENQARREGKGLWGVARGKRP